MGGWGSGWQGPRKTTVEESLVLTASALARRKVLIHGARTSGSWGWTYEGEDKPHATIGYEANLIDSEAAWLRLHYQCRGEPADYRVRLVTTRPTYGGLRWWFICPLERRDGGPPRRVAKLYLPPAVDILVAAKATGLPTLRAGKAENFAGSSVASLPRWGRMKRLSGPHSEAWGHERT
jgi:hypothetical protein